MAIVTISRQFGSGGARVGQAVAQRLGYRYADREILAEAARTLRLDLQELEPLEERTASVWERIAMLFALGAPDTPFIPPTLPSVTESQLFAVEKTIIRNIADRGNAVIVGRGAAHVLQDVPDVLRVFLHAPLDTRVSLAMEEYGLPDRAAAEQIVRDSDAARATFINSIVKRDWCDAGLYDVTMDVSAVGRERVVDIIFNLVQRTPVAALPPLTPRAAAKRDAS